MSAGVSSSVRGVYYGALQYAGFWHRDFWNLHRFDCLLCLYRLALTFKHHSSGLDHQIGIGAYRGWRYGYIW